MALKTPLLLLCIFLVKGSSLQIRSDSLCSSRTTTAAINRQIHRQIVARRMVNGATNDGDVDGASRFGQKFDGLTRTRIVKKEYTIIGPDDAQSPSLVMKYFIQGFVGIWAFGYSALFVAELSGDGLGDSGGYIGTSFAVFLLLALVGAAAYETFKPSTE